LAVIVMAEGSETPDGERGHGPEGRGPRGEGDLLAERRARRAAESGEVALTRRAEAAEATVETLERHVASLQQRLREAEDGRQQIDEQIEAQRSEALEREHELRRVKQREYAEQQLRVEVEERLLLLEREGRAEIEGLSSRLNAREREARELALRLQDVQRELAEAEQAAARENDPARPIGSAPASTAVRSPPSVSEREMQARLERLECRTTEIERRLDGERAARERSERLLEGMREGHRRMEALVAEIKGLVARVSSALIRDQGASGEEPARPVPALLDPGRQAPAEHEQEGTEMADALAAAVERLRARAETVQPALEQTPTQRAGAAGQAAVAPAPAERGQARPPAPATLPAHKHALSWFGRMKIKRKQRRTP
jgi:hypothetical protein